MPKQGSFVHRTIKTGLSVAYGTSFSTSTTTFLNLLSADSRAGYKPPGKPGDAFQGSLQLIRIRGTAAGGASQITIKGTWDSAGKELIVAPTTVVLSNDMLDVNGDGQHSTTLLIDAYVANDTDALYLWLKTDSGTFTVSEYEITWVE
jgi:hypothetical protein|tara:strand:- start:812 stop:1255 length:444 start_codon:yes stop_codon:yes gene_type:complete